jgi:hypothetical protein
MRRALAPLALLAALGCQPQATPLYAPWEEGLTLTYENPSLPQPDRTQQRLELRVAQSAVAPGRPDRVGFDVSCMGMTHRLFLGFQGGAIDFVDAQGALQRHVFPAGFPAVDAWQDQGTTYRVLGRAAWTGPRALAATQDPVGVWVEAHPAHGPAVRSFYLPDLGLVEERHERNGQWVTVNLLVGRRFTDLPKTSR